MVWGGKTEHDRTPFVVAGNMTGIRCRDDIVQLYVIPFIKACVVHDYLTQQNVDVLPWQADSSDLSPIEHVWNEMERRLHHLQNQPVTLPEIGLALIRIWNNIPQAFCNPLIRSIRRRCQACINANGGHTGY